MKITIVSPAKQIEKKVINIAKDYLKKEGFTVTVAPEATSKNGYFAGTDDQRLASLQMALDDIETNAILCARGGYGTIRLIENLDFTAFIQNPKYIIGFSDITVLHCKLQQLKIESVHACMPVSFENNTISSLKSLINVLKNETNSYTFKSNTYNKLGKTTAPVIGGNLSILSSLMGTPLEINTDKKILLIEEVDEAMYVIERLLLQLKIAGKFEHLKGLIIGGITKVKDMVFSFDKTIEQIVIDITKNYDFPVCFNFPAGHINDNCAIILGKKATLTVNYDQVFFNQ